MRARAARPPSPMDRCAATTGEGRSGGSSAGSTQRVTATATSSPAMENRPSCASPVKPENSIALKPQIEVSTPRRSVGQMRSNAAPRAAVGGGLREQVDRIVHAFADQRHAEGQRDAVHRAEAEADRRDAGQRAAGDRQQAEDQQPRRAVDRQQDRGDQRGGDERKARGFAAHGCAGGHREHARSGEQQLRLARGGLREGAADLLKRALLRVDGRSPAPGSARAAAPAGRRARTRRRRASPAWPGCRSAPGYAAARRSDPPARSAAPARRRASRAAAGFLPGAARSPAAENRSGVTAELSR